MRRRAGLYGLIQSLIERLIEHQQVDALLTAQMHGNQKREYGIDWRALRNISQYMNNILIWSRVYIYYNQLQILFCCSTALIIA